MQITKPNGSIEIARSNSFGYYKFEDLVADETYIVSVSEKDRVFKQPTRVINLTDNISDFNFVFY